MKNTIMLTCLIVEDDYAFGLNVKVQAQELGLKVLGIVGNIKSIKEMLKKHHVDLILSDLKLEGGEYVNEFFSSINIDIPIILFSAFSSEELYEKSSSVNPYIYLTKPFDNITLRSAIQGALRDKLEAQKKGGEIECENQSIFIKNQGKLISIERDDLRLIQSEGNHCYLFLNNKRIIIRSSMKNILDKVKSSQLIQVHRSFIVNYNFIQEVDISENNITIENIEVPIGRKFKKEFLNGLH